MTTLETSMYSAGYRQGNSQFNQQCFLCCLRKEKTASEGQTDDKYEPTVSITTRKVMVKFEIVLMIMVTAFLRKYWIKSFNLSLPPNLQGKEPDWDYPWRMIL